MQRNNARRVSIPDILSLIGVYAMLFFLSRVSIDARTQGVAGLSVTQRFRRTESLGQAAIPP